MPVHLGIGDRDDRAISRRHLPHLVSDGSAQDRARLPNDGAPMLDTWEEGSHAGSSYGARAAWLDARLAEAERPVLPFLHRDPMPSGIAPMDEIVMQGAHRLGDAFESHPGRARRILHGDRRLPMSGSLRDVPFGAPRGTSHAGRAERREAGSDLPNACAAAMIEDGSIPVHMIEGGHEAAGGARARPTGAHEIA